MDKLEDSVHPSFCPRKKTTRDKEMKSVGWRGERHERKGQSRRSVGHKIRSGVLVPNRAQRGENTCLWEWAEPLVWKGRETYIITEFYKPGLRSQPSVFSVPAPRLPNILGEEILKPCQVVLLHPGFSWAPAMALAQWTTFPSTRQQRENSCLCVYIHRQIGGRR